MGYRPSPWRNIKWHFGLNRLWRRGFSDPGNKFVRLAENCRRRRCIKLIHINIAFLVKSPKRIGCASVNMAASFASVFCCWTVILPVKKQMTDLKKCDQFEAPVCKFLRNVSRVYIFYSFLAPELWLWPKRVDCNFGFIREKLKWLPLRKTNVSSVSGDIAKNVSASVIYKSKNYTHVLYQKG